MSYKKYYEGGWQSGETGGTPITPEALNHMEQGIVDAAPMEYAKKVGAPHNLLDNSDFRNPVNQRGRTSYTTEGYTIDRWNANANIESVTVSNSGVTVKSKTGYNGFWRQYIDSTQLFGKSLTFACKLSNREVLACSCVYPLSNPTNETILVELRAGDVHLLVNAQSARAVCQLRVNNGASVTIEWAALYEGEYTVKTLPEYQPKGYAAELAECMRYFQRYVPRENAAEALNAGFAHSATLVRVGVILPVPMRITPTLTIADLSAWRLIGHEKFLAFTGASLLNAPNTADVSSISIQLTGTSFTANNVYALKANTEWTLSADL